jgi:protease IV
MKNLSSSILRGIQHFLKNFWKIWVVVSSVVGSLVLVIVIAGLVSLSSETSTLQQPMMSKKQLRGGGPDIVAVVNLTGPIFEESGESDPLALSSAIVSSRRVTQTLQELSDDPSVKAVVLRMNTPGGTVVASDDIYQAVRKLREKKPVVTSMGDVAASGGYYIAAGGSEIVANYSTITGSIGVIAQFPNLSGLYEKVGVDMRVIKSGEFKDIGSANREMSEEELAILDSIVQDSYQQFVEAIATGRDMDIDKVRMLADGRIYSGRQAQEAGLVDRLGNFDTAITVAEELADISNAQVLEYSSQSFFESLLQSKLGLAPLQSLNKVVAPDRFKLYYLMDI